jgi:hypothetical protein
MYNFIQRIIIIGASICFVSFGVYAMTTWPNIAGEPGVPAE